MPRNSLVNGKLAPDSFGIQLDEVTYPILMAWQAGLGDRAFYRDHIKRAADFAISHGPSFGSERWEEQGGFSPSTIAAEIAGLVAAADTVVTTTAAADGAWSVEVPVKGGTIVLDAVATSPQGATAHVQRTVVFDVTPGEVLLDVTDPDGDDNGPGNYAYPTSPTSGRAPTTSSGSRSSTTVPT